MDHDNMTILFFKAVLVAFAVIVGIVIAGIWSVLCLFALWFIIKTVGDILHDLSQWYKGWRIECRERRRTHFREVYMDKFARKG